MKIVRYINENGDKLIIGEVTVSGLSKKIEVSYLQPDIDLRLIHFLADVCERGHVEVLWPRQIEGGVEEVMVQIKPGSKYFWPSLDHNISAYGYTIEE